MDGGTQLEDQNPVLGISMHGNNFRRIPQIPLPMPSLVSHHLAQQSAQPAVPADLEDPTLVHLRRLPHLSVQLRATV